MSGYALAYTALAVRDVVSTCRFLGDALGLARTDAALGERTIPCFGVGNAALAVFAADDAFLDAPRFPGVHHVALCAADPQAAAARHALPVTGAGVGPQGARYVAIDSAATAGVRTRFSEPVPVSTAPGPVCRIDHLGVASDDNEAAVRVFVDNLGCALESTQTDIAIRQVTESFVSDRYGAVYHARAPEILGGLRDVFVTVGDCELEFLMDFDPAMRPLDALGARPGDTKGDQSAIARFIARRGPGLAHVAFATRDIDGLLSALGAGGWRLIDGVGRPGGRASRIGFVHPANFGGGLVVHFVEREPDL